MATYPGAEDGHVRGDLATGSWTSLRKPMALDNTCAGYSLPDGLITEATVGCGLE